MCSEGPERSDFKTYPNTIDSKSVKREHRVSGSNHTFCTRPKLQERKTLPRSVLAFVSAHRTSESVQVERVWRSCVALSLAAYTLMLSMTSRDQP